MGPMAAPGAEPADAQTLQSTFDSTVRKINIKHGAVSVPVEWSYTNRWDFPMVVEGFEHSCGCLSGHPDQKAVDPGKTGRIQAVFKPGTYRGTVRKSLHVRFVGFDKPVELVAEASIPCSVELSARDLTWELGDSKPQSVDVTTGTGADFRITGLVGIDEHQFTIGETAVTEGRHYRLAITPKAALGAGTRCLQVRTDSADPRDRVLAVFLHVESGNASVVHPPLSPVHQEVPTS